MLEVKNISKTFQSVAAVQDLSFEVKQGGIFGLIGPNGAGKSTTIRMLMGIIQPDSGSISLSGTPMVQVPMGKLGYLPEERGLYKKQKVNDVLKFFAQIKGADIKAAQNNIDRWLETFELTQWKHSPISELSKGMGQKVQFIGSIAHDPDVVLFDEPFSGLDPSSQQVLLDAIENLRKEGKLILFSTHIMEHAEKICSDILLLDHGQKVAYGPLDQVKTTYGKKMALVEFDGDGSFIPTLDGVTKASNYPRYTEIEVAEGADPASLLPQLVEKLRVLRFEVATPSLNRIFLDLTGTKTEEVTQ